MTRCRYVSLHYYLCCKEMYLSRENVGICAVIPLIYTRGQLCVA